MTPHESGRSLRTAFSGPVSPELRAVLVKAFSRTSGSHLQGAGDSFQVLGGGLWAQRPRETPLTAGMSPRLLGDSGRRWFQSEDAIGAWKKQGGGKPHE